MATPGSQRTRASKVTRSADATLLLRRPRPADAAAFLAATRASRHFHHPWIRAPLTPAEFSRYLARARREDFDANLLLRGDGALLGVFNLSQIFYGPFCSAYLGYYALAPHHGQGHMRAGLTLLLARAFGPLRLHRVEANLQPENLRSRRLVEAAGFRLEGYSPRYLKIAGRWRDHERWAILREDFQNRPRLI